MYVYIMLYLLCITYFIVYLKFLQLDKYGLDLIRESLLIDTFLNRAF